MKAVLMSIQPKWCELIVSGKKTVEVRKTKPKLEVPFKVYIYCTKDNTDIVPSRIWWKADETGFKHILNGQVIGEFVCDKIYDITPHFDTPFPNQYICGWEYGKEFDCLSFEELTSYLNGKKGYGWHISNLVIYDKPRELGKFHLPCNHKGDCVTCKHFEYFLDCSEGICSLIVGGLERPPQSWCYVERSESDG